MLFGLHRCSSERRRDVWLKRFLYVVALVAVSALASVTTLWLRHEAVTSTGSAVEPLWATFGDRPEPITTKVKVRVVRSPTTDVLAPKWGGIVTSVGIKAGDILDPINSGPLAIDGVQRAWFVSSTPLFRAIDSKSVGTDVDSLATFLQSQGVWLDHTPGERGGSAMLTAIRQWAEPRGFGRNVAQFDPGWVIWLDESLIGARVLSVATQVGAEAPAMGSKVLTTGGAVESIEVIDDPSQQRSVAVDGVTDAIEVAGRQYAFVDGRLSTDGLIALDGALFSDQVDTTLTLTHSFPDGAFGVPASALLPNGAESFCIVVRIGDAQQAIGVAVVGAGAGTAVVERLDGVSRDAEVLINPAALAWSCG
jgi:hypothetical protein